MEPNDFVGEVIDGYKIVERLGPSMVFLGFKQSLPTQQVAIKIFRPDPVACNRDVILERLREVNRLDHENIVKVYEVGESQDFLYAVMEYIPGENLYDLMQRNPRLHWGAAAELARDIVRALAAAHKQGVIHRSLHPDRIILGRASCLKVSFCNEGEISLSKEIVHYVAPELFLGEELEAGADIYSLGAIIYNIVIGKPPLSGKEPKEVALKHREKAPVLPSYGVEDIPHSLSVILTRSLNIDSKKRYDRCYEVLAALNNFLKNDIGNYPLGAYKELFKRVEVSPSGKAFTKKVEKQKRVVDVPDPSPGKSDGKVEDGKLPGWDWTRLLGWKIIAACLLSLIANLLILSFLL